MWRTLSYYCRVGYNFFRLFFWSMLNNGRLKYNGAQKISIKAKLSMGRNGRIILGNRCMLEDGVLLHATSGNIQLGKKVFVNRNTNIVCHEQIVIGDYVTIGPNVCIYDHDHDTKKWNSFKSSAIEIGSKVWIGANVIILKGVTIGEGCIIGAGTVVSRDIPANSICYNKRENMIINNKR